jgi:flagellar assembly protein FliH
MAFPEEKLEALFSTIENLRLLSAKLAEQARSDALELAFQIAKRILESEVRTNPEPLFKLIRSAIRRISEARTINIRLSPEDASAFELENGAQKVGARLAQINVVADPSLERGDCVLDSDLGMVDGRLQNRLAELRRSVESALEGDAA